MTIGMSSRGATESMKQAEDYSKLRYTRNICTMFTPRKLLFALSSVLMSNCQTTSSSKPHVILIVADDMGWNDVSFHGANEIPTPNIDALAYNGVILNRHYVQPVCTPSRTALLTSRYPIREGLQGDPLDIGEHRSLRLNVTIMPEHMRRLGYETRLLGKWHLGYRTENHTPARRGFDTFFGYYNGYITYFDKTCIAELKNGTTVVGYDFHRDVPDGLHVEPRNTEYFTDLITDEAERIIKNNGNAKPLFLEIAHLATHASGSAVESLEVRDPSENDASFAYISDSDSRKYAGMMKAMDDSVGRVVEALANAKMLDNAIIVFMSDNGAPTFSAKFQTPGSNYPLRGMKGTVFEGGIRGAACIFSALISNASRVSEELMHITDWLPTLYSAAGGNVSDLGVIDGANQWDSLVNGVASPRKHLLVNINEIAGEQAAISGRYKLVQGARVAGEGYYGRTGNDASFPVYDAERALASPAALAIGRLSRFEIASPGEARKLRELAAAKCERPTSWPNCSATCLFDIVNDPCETTDLSSLHTEQLQYLRSYVDAFRRVLVPQQSKVVDFCSFPRYFGGSWMPWKRDDANETNIVPECVCRVDSSLA